MDTVDRIFELISKKGLMQKEFAEIIGVSDDKVSTWRTRRTKSYTKCLPQIAEVLGTTVEYLLNGTKEKPETQPGSGLSEGEQLLISLFRMLSQEDKDAVLRVVQAAANGKRSPE